MDLIKSLDEKIISYVAPDGKIIPSRCCKSVLMKHGFYDYLMSRYSDNTSKSDSPEYLKESIYRLVNHIDTVPVCKTCGSPIKFKYNTYQTYCSRKCSNNDPDIKEKISETCSESLKKAYEERGESIKQKRRDTLSDKYGVEMRSSSPFAIESVQEKAENTIVEKYGVTNVLKLEKNIEKRKEVQRSNSIELQSFRGLDIEYLPDGNYLVKNCCPIHGSLTYSKTDFNNRFKPERMFISNPCYKCNPFGTLSSGIEESLLSYIRSIYNGKIITNDRTELGGLEIDVYLPDLKLGFEFNGDYWHMNPLRYRCNSLNETTGKSAFDKWAEDRHKQILASDKGITIYPIWENDYMYDNQKVKEYIYSLVKGETVYINPLCKLKSAIDKINPGYVLVDDMVFQFDNLKIVYLDGFHFNKNTISNDFLDKFVSDGHRTIFVYDYEIYDIRKFKIILSDIKYALGCIDRRIYARKCQIREINNSDARQFILDNSLFGYRSASITIGLYYQDELVMVYSFGNNYYGRKGYTEVIRVCTKKNTQVIGGSSKCLDYYLKTHSSNGETIIFYVDAIHHSGSSLKYGFEFVRHEYGLMNYWLDFDKRGFAFNRMPSKNKEIKALIKNGHVVEIPTYGVDVYKLESTTSL